MIQRLRTYFFETSVTEVAQPRSLRWFQIALYGWLFIHALTLWPALGDLYSHDKLLYRHGVPGSFLENFFYQLMWHPTRLPYIYGLHIVASLIGCLDKRWSIIPRLASWITGWLLFYAAPEAFNSGFMLMNLLALFAAPSFVQAKTAQGILLTNAARWVCIIQVCIVYITAGIYKLMGDQWLEGTALYYALNIDHFSTSWVKSIIQSAPWIGTIATWCGLAYQLLFPLVLWIKRGRIVFLSFGIAFHLFIGSVMHLWDFATAMLCCYLLFIPFNKKG